MIKLGDKVRDTVTGFEGVAIAKTDWLYGCVRFMVMPAKLDKDGNTMKAEQFDEAQLKVVQDKVVAGDTVPPKQRTGGPKPMPTR